MGYCISLWINSNNHLLNLCKTYFIPYLIESSHQTRYCLYFIHFKDVIQSSERIYNFPKVLVFIESNFSGCLNYKFCNFLWLAWLPFVLTLRRYSIKYFQVHHSFSFMGFIVLILGYFFNLWFDYYSYSFSFLWLLFIFNFSRTHITK